MSDNLLSGGKGGKLSEWGGGKREGDGRVMCQISKPTPHDLAKSHWIQWKGQYYGIHQQPWVDADNMNGWLAKKPPALSATCTPVGVRGFPD